MRFKSNRHRLGWGLFCLAVSGTVLGLTLFKQASWSIDGIEAVVVLLPIGIHLVLKATLGFDLVAALGLSRWLGEKG